MRLSKENLKKIIKEELEAVVNEVRVAPDLEGLPDDFKMKINSLIDAGETNQAQSLIDALGGDPNYIKNYIEYQRVGDIEKLGTKAASQTYQDFQDTMTDAFKLANKRTDEMHPDLASRHYQSLADMDRATDTLNTHTDRFFSAHDAAIAAQKRKSGLKESLLYEGDGSILEHFHGAVLEEGGLVCEACLFEQLQEASCGCPDLMGEAEYQGRKVTLNKPMRGDVKKFKVYVKDPKTGNVKKVNFGDPNMKIKKSNPKRRKSFRARHNCDNPGPKTKARYWSCKKW